MANTSTRRTTQTKNTYVSGSAAPKIPASRSQSAQRTRASSASPARKSTTPVPSTTTDYRKKIKEQQEQERRNELRRKKRAERIAKERALRNTKQYVMFLTFGIIVFGLFSGVYIKIQSDITARMRTISRLESQIADLKSENDEAYKRLNTAVDLDNIKDVAINELGMFYATPEQIIYYDVANDDYMNQYTDIPKN